MRKDGLTTQEVKDLKQIWRRSNLINGSMQAIKRQGMGFCYTLLPLLDRVYKDDEQARIEAMQRNNEFLNSHASTVTFLMGLTYALEKSKAEGGPVTGDVIRNIKTSLMGPLAGIGDSIFHVTLRVVGAGIGITFAEQGNPLGALIFLLIYGGCFQLIKWPLIKVGYTVGTKYLNDLFEKGLIHSITKAASILGLSMVGCLTATLVSAPTTLAITFGEAEVSLQETLDAILPNGLSLVVLFAVYWLVKKKVSVVKIIFLIMGFGILMNFLGVM